MTTAGYHAMVFDRGNVALASPRECVQRPVSAGATEQPKHILDRAADLIGGHAAGVVVLDGGPELLATWKRQTVATGASGDRVALVDDEGWTATGVEPWTTWRRSNAPAIHVAFWGSIDPGRTPLFAQGMGAGEVARRLAWYAEKIGGPFFMTPGVAGHGAIRAVYRKPGKGAQPYWGARDWRETDDYRTGVGDLLWRRAPMRTEVEECEWVHAFDLNAARLSALGVVEVGWSKLRRTGDIAFDPTLAGYWQIHARDVRQHPRHPPIIDPANIHDGMAWPTTPVMKMLMDAGTLPAVADSWTTPGRRMFRQVAERWNAARVTAMGSDGGLPLDAVKATYREAAGLFAHRGGSIYRPDWYHATMDRQRVTVLGHYNRIARDYGRRALAIHTDCLWFACKEEDPRSAAAHLGINLGHALGTFRVHGSTPIGEFFKLGGKR